MSSHTDIVREAVVADRHGRRFRNLRVSLTAACNYACEYCVPNGKRLQPAKYELDDAEMIRSVRLLVAAAGITKLRITGGEPLLSPKFDAFLPAVTALGLDDVSITTNGQLVLRKLPVLEASGIRRMNISLDTLDPEGFVRLARGGDLETVLAGIDALLDCGIQLKVNMVPVRSHNADQIVPMLDYCLERGIELRFIELMKMGHLKRDPRFECEFIGLEELLDRIGAKYHYEKTDAPFDSTSIRYRVASGGHFGVIANESEPFCRNCTRLRLASNGKLFGCLSNSHSHDLKPLLELDDASALAALPALLNSALGDKQPLSFQGEVTVMKFIGG